MILLVYLYNTFIHRSILWQYVYLWIPQIQCFHLKNIPRNQKLRNFIYSIAEFSRFFNWNLGCVLQIICPCWTRLFDIGRILFLYFVYEGAYFVTAYFKRRCGRMLGENAEWINIFHMLLLYLHFSLMLTNLQPKYVQDYILTL